MLKLDYNGVYTKPDITENKSTLLSVAVTHSVSDNVIFTSNVYYRKMLTRTLNADINEGALNQNIYRTAAGENATNTPFPFLRCIDNVLLNATPGEQCNGLINRTRTAQDNYGLSGQFTVLGALAGYKHQFTGGAAYDASMVKFSQTTQIGYLTGDRSITGLNAYADGVLCAVIATYH